MNGVAAGCITMWNIVGRQVAAKKVLWGVVAMLWSEFSCFMVFKCLCRFKHAAVRFGSQKKDSVCHDVLINVLS